MAAEPVLLLTSSDYHKHENGPNGSTIVGPSLAEGGSGLHLSFLYVKAAGLLG